MLHHLDTIYFGPGQMLLFKYPMLKRKFDEMYAAIQKEDEAQEMTEDEQREKAFDLLKQVGVTEDLNNLVCEDYTEEEIKQDHDKVDWEQALMTIEEAQNVKRQEELEMIAEQERKKA